MARKVYGIALLPEHKAYHHMKDRCLNPKSSTYHHYGGRGIRICKRWLESFGNFYADMGPKPEPKKNYSIDRKNNDLHYSCGHCKQCKKHGWPANCRWATKSEQNRNTRVSGRYTFQGVTGTVKDLIEHFKLDIREGTVKARINILGMSIKEALTSPIIQVHKLTKRDVIAIRRKFITGNQTKAQLAKEFDVTRRTIRNIINKITWNK